MTCLTCCIFLTCWFSTFFHTASHHESLWNCFRNGMMGYLSWCSCSTSYLSISAWQSVHFFCSCRPFEKVAILLMWVVSPLDSWCNFPKDGGSSIFSWSCGHCMLWICSEYRPSIFFLAWRSAWGRRMINIFLRNLPWHTIVLLWTYHHTWFWIPGQHIWAGIYVVMWLQWQIWYIHWCWTSYTISCWWGYVDENCKIPLLVHTQWWRAADIFVGPR